MAGSEATTNKNKAQKYRFFIKDNVVFDIPSDVYCPKQVDDWCKAIIKTASQLDKWIILSIPDISHTITHDAAVRMKKDLSALDAHGCQGVLILTSTVNAKIFAHALAGSKDGLTITTSESIETLCQQAQKLLGSDAVLNYVNR